MRKLVIFGLLLVVIHVAFISMSKLVGYRQPIDPSITRYHLDDCKLPCWAGIHLRDVSYVDAYTPVLNTFPAYKDLADRFSSRLGDSNGNLLPTWDQPLHLGSRTNPDDQFIISFNLIEPSSQVQGITLTAVSSSHLPSILDLSALYGAPVCVVQNPGISNTQLIAFYQSPDTDYWYVTARIMNRGKGWNQHPYEIKLLTSFPDQCKQWKGFTNLSKHLPKK